MPSSKIQIPLAKSDIGQAETNAVTRVMASGRLALGQEITAFEQEFATWHGVRSAAMTNSGTSALTCALRALGVGPGDEVIIPALTFIGTANAILNCGALPILVDVKPDSGNIDVNLLHRSISGKCKALVPVHLFGHAADIADIMEIAATHDLAVVEDAAEALGSQCNGQLAGTIADAGIFGFYPNKVLTTGEGGMVISQDEALIERCRAIANQGVVSGHQATTPGMSFRGNELGAAIGRAQLAGLHERLAYRTELAAHYQRELTNNGQMRIFGFTNSVQGWFTIPVLLPENTDRDRLRADLATDGIATAAYFPAIHTLVGYQHLASRYELGVSELLGSRLIALPLWSEIEPHIAHICERLCFHLDPP